MTTPARQAEADRVESAFQTALAAIGIETIEEALSLWEDVPPTGKAALSERWLRAAVRLVLRHRPITRDLGLAYYRLIRALRTGRTIALPYEAEPRQITLTDLREEFYDLAGLEPEGESTPETGEVVEQDEIPELADDLEQLEEDAEVEAEIDLKALGPANLDDKISKIDTSAPGDDVDAAREDAHAKAGARQAATAARLVKNGARSAVWTAAQNDKAVIAYARVSTTGTPCGFCAMLISRGAVYKSKQSATFNDGDLYHDNCNCIAVPLFSDAEFNDSDRFALNREYMDLWPEVTRGLSGKAALAAWRRFIRQQQRDAQEASQSSPGG